MRAPLIAALALVACGGGDDPRPAVPLYAADPLAAENPIPDDRLRDATTGAVRLAQRAGFWVPYVPAAAVNPTLEAVYAGYADQLGEQTGWGPYAPIAIAFAGDPSAAIPDGFKLLDAAGAAVEHEARWNPDPGFVTLLPRAPLAPGERHLVVVLAGAGVAAAPAADPAAVAEAAAALGVAPDVIALAYPVTTGRPTADLETATAIVAAAPPPAHDVTPDPMNPRWPRGVMTRDELLAAFPPGDTRDELTIALASAGTIAVGTYASLDFRAADRTLDPALVDGTLPAPPVDVEFVLVLPDRMAFPPPWPVTIIQHGFQASALEVFLRARAFTDAGIATIGIDAVAHGRRGTVADFIIPDNLRLVRDNFRQTVLDLVQLCRLASAGGIDVVPPTGPDLDGRCFYIGQSFGGVVGGMYAALSPDTEVAVLNVAGGGLTTILQSETLGGLVRLLFQPALGLAGNDPGWDGNLAFLTVLAQNLLEPADPIHYGRLVFAAGNRHVLIQSGRGDTLVPDATARALAGAIGIPELTMPITAAAGVSGQWWVDLLDFGITPEPAVTDPHAILNLVPGVPRQAATYMTSGGTVVVDPATVNAPFE
jgi:hypothetical protein